MQYSRVHMEAIGYELPPVVVTSAALEESLAPMYELLHIAPGQLKMLTGIHERRWWRQGQTLSDGAVAAVKKALQQCNVECRDIEALVYTGVCRENFEPATACAVAAKLGIRDSANIYDISNACLGVLNGIVDIANRIELKQIRAGIVVSCETSQEIIEAVIKRMLNEKTIAMFSHSLATLTCGSGAAAVLLTDGSFDNQQTHKLLGAVTRTAPEHHALCRWGVDILPTGLSDLVLSPDRLMSMIEEILEPNVLPSVVKEIMNSKNIPEALANMMPTETLPRVLTEFMSTDSVAVLKHGVKLGVKTWGAFLTKMGWAKDQVDKVICHQVGDCHKQTILRELGIDAAKDFSTYQYFGNVGTVSVPLTAAIADQRKFFKPGDCVGFLGIGSGLNCMILGWEW